MIEFRTETRQRIHAENTCLKIRSLKTMTKATASTFWDQFSVFYYVCLTES